MFHPENQSKKYESLFNDIDTGIMKIPKFQRDFVWTKEQTASLIDSIIKGFPIGTFIIWKTREEMRYYKNIGKNITLPEIPKGDAALYVLDGQQRITSLYAVRKGAIFDKDGQDLDYRQISINLELDPDSEERVVTVDPPEDAPSITVYSLLNGTISGLAKDYGEFLDKIDIYKGRLTGYDFSIILIPEYPIDIACEIFTRINTGGTELTLFEIMVAKTFDPEKKFDLAEQYQKLLNNNGTGKDLEDANFDTVPASTVLQCVSTYINKQIRRKDILKIQRAEFIESWPIVVDGIFTAVDYFRSHLRIPVSGLLPYNAILIPFTYFFIRNYNRMPSAKQNVLLTQYFWWASLSSRFSSGLENKIAQDLERIDSILKEESPSYRGEEVQLSLDDIRWRWFSTGDAFCKAVLCLYTYFIPKSFKNDSLVLLDNSWLKLTTSKNYHHFFPRSYLTKKREIPDWKANSILNITIVDDHLNKHSIGAKAPSDYMLNFLDTNPNLEITMESHLIDNLDEFGVWEDDYERFIEKRGIRVIAELNRRLYPDT